VSCDAIDRLFSIRRIARQFSRVFSHRCACQGRGRGRRRRPRSRQPFRRGASASAPACTCATPFGKACAGRSDRKAGAGRSSQKACACGSGERENPTRLLAPAALPASAQVPTSPRGRLLRSRRRTVGHTDPLSAAGKRCGRRQNELSPHLRCGCLCGAFRGGRRSTRDGHALQYPATTLLASSLASSGSTAGDRRAPTAQKVFNPGGSRARPVALGWRLHAAGHAHSHRGFPCSPGSSSLR
jgi:hypothetical protein